ncbi:MAG TPA: hypothetical protein VIC82_05025 [Candidatus Nanopelagicales bacterium]|jgi:hypothetical protein
MRVYLPLSMSLLQELSEAGVTTAPLPAHAVTTALRAAWPSADQDELEYAVLMAAAYDSLLRLAADPRERARRVVAVAEVADGAAVAGTGDEVTAVTLTAPVPLARVTAVHVDEPGAEAAVRAAAGQVVAATAGDGRALGAVSLVDHELLWYATQEIADLFAES